MRYENLEVWQRSFRLSIKIYKAFEQLKDFGLKDQMCRAGVSVPSNIADKIAGANFERACAASKRRNEWIH